MKPFGLTRLLPTPSSPTTQPTTMADPAFAPPAAGAPSADHDPATAILRPKKSPNRLLVDEATGDDNSVATIHPNTMELLGLFRGDTVVVKGKKRKDTGEL